MVVIVLSATPTGIQGLTIGQVVLALNTQSMSMNEWVSSMSVAVPTRSQFRWFLVSTVTLGIVSSVALWTVGITDVEIHLVAMFLALLVTSELFPPVADEQWWRWLLLFKLIGWLVTLYVLFERVSGVTQ